MTYTFSLKQKAVDVAFALGALAALVGEAVWMAGGLS